MLSALLKATARILITIYALEYSNCIKSSAIVEDEYEYNVFGEHI